MNKKIKIAATILIFGFILFAVISFLWIKERLKYASTDAVFIKSDTISNVGFKRVSGKIISMNFKEGDKVKKGDILATIDDKDYKLKAEQIKYEMESLENQIKSLKLKSSKSSSDISFTTDIQKDKISSIEYEINATEKSIKEIDIHINQALRDYERYKNLYEQNAIPKKSFEDVSNNLESLKLKKESMINKLNSLKKNRDMLSKEIYLIENNRLSVSEIEKNRMSLVEKLNSLKKEYEDMQNLIEDCKLIASQDGQIGMKYAEIGSVVGPGGFVYSIIDDTNLYAYVLLEENKIEGVNPGDKAIIKLDAYKKEVFEGEVEKIYPASAATYALVPRDISAGEFTKVAQRIPIRVKITSGKKELLKVGMGGEIKIKR
ncbi:MAG: HlyD family secretion protein [Calditerrivibrio sp.]|nr:HlyD family secretion protein [Calditerrivibrio sp.]MCA1980232.1 HlyD family secretion protein [Calditerrivibrio sp.]